MVSFDSCASSRDKWSVVTVTWLVVTVSSQDTRWFEVTVVSELLEKLVYETNTLPDVVPLK